MKPTHGNWPKGLCSVYEAEGQPCSGWRRLEAEIEGLRYVLRDTAEDLSSDDPTPPKLLAGIISKALEGGQ